MKQWARVYTKLQDYPDPVIHTYIHTLTPMTSYQQLQKSLIRKCKYKNFFYGLFKFIDNIETARRITRLQTTSKTIIIKAIWKPQSHQKLSYYQFGRITNIFCILSCIQRSSWPIQMSTINKEGIGETTITKKFVFQQYMFLDIFSNSWKTIEGWRYVVYSSDQFAKSLIGTWNDTSVQFLLISIRRSRQKPKDYRTKWKIYNWFTVHHLFKGLYFIRRNRKLSYLLQY